MENIIEASLLCCPQHNAYFVYRKLNQGLQHVRLQSGRATDRFINILPQAMTITYLCDAEVSTIVTAVKACLSIVLLRTTKL